MNNEKVLELVDSIEKNLRALVAVTGEENISAYMIGGSFSLDSFANENGQKILSFFRSEATNE